MCNKADIKCYMFQNILRFNFEIECRYILELVRFSIYEASGYFATLLHIYKFHLIYLNKIMIQGVCYVIVAILKWGASSRWSFGPNIADRDNREYATHVFRST